MIYGKVAVGKIKPWVTMETYEEGRPISVAPLELMIRQLGYYLAIYCEHMPREESVRFFELGKLEAHDSEDWKGPGTLNPYVNERLPRIQELAARLDRKLLPLSPKNFLRGLKARQDEVDYLRAHMTRDKLLLQEHFTAFACDLSDGLRGESPRRNKGFHVSVFYELAELRDSIYYEWTLEKLKRYLSLSDELMASEAYEGWHRYVASKDYIFSPLKLRSLEEIRELRDELEVRGLLSS